MIRQIELRNFRNYETLSLAVDAECNLFIGNNGQGKTNLLEAIFFTSMLRSFRTARMAELKKIGSRGFYIGTKAVAGTGLARWYEIDYNNNGRRISIDGKVSPRSSDLVRNFRTVAFLPDDIGIVTGNSGLRRRFVDMFLSITDPHYLVSLHHYLSALQMRNAVLKDSRADMGLIAAYEPIMAKAAAYVADCRREYAARLALEIGTLLEGFYNVSSGFSVRYRSDTEGGIEAWHNKLAAERRKDRLRGFTGFGLQLDDFDFILNDKLLRHYGSTGQCRLISLVMKMANVNILAAEAQGNKDKIIVLVDDVTGELDDATRQAFYRVIGQAGQLFFTFTSLPGDDYFRHAAVFQVNNGEITPVSSSNQVNNG
ncbi:MAG: DNA replication and repair protein RecF [Victivallales bacterium]|nr:DNA replication and repair protein RecF [Victivallales bacterium]